ncbi:hypothetical protein [Saccharothrix carnea]|uniref:hypothetical protein n=1 Tax=Saccharothrix carnea TaxID=1280637 RepID=UPI0011B1F3F4|nr:hypothetical protein [Saccharothrix carnea]
MQVAQEFRRAGTSYVEQSTYYTDSTNGVVREIDVLAQWFGTARGSASSENLNIYFPIECKSGAAPWVVFTGSDEQLVPFDAGTALEFMPSLGLDAKLADDFIGNLEAHEDGFLDAASDWLDPGYQITEKRNTEKGGKDPAYDAVRQVASGTLGALKEIEELPRYV